GRPLNLDDETQPEIKNMNTPQSNVPIFSYWLCRSMPAFLILAAIGGAVSLAEPPPEGPFLAENEAAMTKMMAAMNVKPSGDVDRDFVATMTPHHQGAIDMAQAFLRYGRN